MGGTFIIKMRSGTAKLLLSLIVGWLILSTVITGLSLWRANIAEDITQKVLGDNIYATELAEQSIKAARYFRDLALGAYQSKPVIPQKETVGTKI